jgi:hypothetical protein
MTAAYVEAIAVIGPGLSDWEEAVGALRDPSTYRADGVIADAAIGVPPNERRRTTPLIRLTLGVLDQLAKRSALDLSQAASVFATSWGDMEVIQNMMNALIGPGIPVSPVQFHNMVHNAAAGFWSIGTRARKASTSLTAGERTFAAGLTDAVAWVATRNETVLFVCYDYPGPAIFNRYNPIDAQFAVAMALTAERTDRSCCRVQIGYIPETPESVMAQPDLESLRTGNPAARALPFLAAIANGVGDRVIVSSAAPGSSVAIDVVPVS